MTGFTFRGFMTGFHFRSFMTGFTFRGFMNGFTFRDLWFGTGISKSKRFLGAGAWLSLSTVCLFLGAGLGLGGSSLSSVLLNTSCPARRCSGIRAPLNFVASLLLAPLNFVASFLFSAHVLKFVASLWSAQLPRLPIDRSTHRKPHWETSFSVELLRAWKKKAVFER